MVMRGIVLKGTLNPSPSLRYAAGSIAIPHQPPICLQRGLYISITMLIKCYESHAHCADTLEQLWLCSEWISAIPGGIRFYIREDRSSLAMCIDSELKRKPREDYVL